MSRDKCRTEPSNTRVCRSPASAALADLLRASLVQAVGEVFVGGLHPFVVSPRTPQQVEAVLRVCAHHRLGLSVVGGLAMAGAKSACGDVDVVLSLDTLIGEYTLQERGIREPCALRQDDRAAAWPTASTTALHESR